MRMTVDPAAEFCCVHESHGIERVETTFWMDFTIADAFGKNAIKDTYKRAFRDWKKNIRYMTELVMTLNHKMWEHEADSFCEVYGEMFEQARNYVMDNFTGDELGFYLDVTD